MTSYFDYAYLKLMYCHINLKLYEFNQKIKTTVSVLLNTSQMLHKNAITL